MITYDHIVFQTKKRTEKFDCCDLWKYFGRVNLDKVRISDIFRHEQNNPALRTLERFSIT